MFSKSVRTIITLFFLVLASCTPSATYLKKISKTQNTNVAANYIRVLIGTYNSPLSIYCDRSFRVFKKKNRQLVYESRKGMLKFYPERVREPYIIETTGSPVFVDNTGYRGNIEIHDVMGKLYVVNVINVEQYLYSVVPSEMPYSWNLEALKAQSVAARTYTYYHLMKDDNKNQIYQVDSSTRFQVYKGISSEKPSSTKAVNETAGIIMTYKYSPILSYFHSTSGGFTADDKDVWTGNDLPYLESVKSEYENESPHMNWKAVVSVYEIKEALRKKYPHIGSIRKVAFNKKNGRVSGVVVVHSNGTINMTGNHFRLLFPPKKLRSTYFISQKVGNTLEITGKGWGHGVGMSQWGAKGMADRGIKFDKILQHYYKDISISKKNNPYFATQEPRRQLVN